MSSTVMAAVTEDEIVRRKLLIDGDGGGDDKRLVLLQKYVIDFCGESSAGSQAGEEASGAGVDMKCEKMIGMLCNIEYQAEKTWQVRRTAASEQQQYDLLLTEIDDKIQTTQTEIEKCKTELLSAKQVRRNKQEYDAWAKKVLELPDRQVTAEELEKERELLGELVRTESELSCKLELRRKQFALLMTSLKELQQIIGEQTSADLSSDMAADYGFNSPDDS